MSFSLIHIAGTAGQVPAQSWDVNSRGEVGVLGSGCATRRLWGEGRGLAAPSGPARVNGSFHPWNEQEAWKQHV